MEKRRELKFRVWDKSTKQMSPGFTLFGEFLLIGAVHAWQYDCGNKAGSSLEALNDLDLMQFTGLLDKNGKEIYEGDVVRFDVQEGREEIEPAKPNQIGVVSMGSIVCYGSWMCIWCKNVNVIGNIYEHPELLKSLLDK